jgi:hypothetical protein
MGRDAMGTLGLRQAAQQAGVSKSTISRAIRSGRLSAARNDDGGFAIDPAEVFRVYPVAPHRSSHRSVGQDAPPSATDATASAAASHTAVIEAQLVGARHLIDLLKSQVEDLRGDRDGWRQQAETAQRLLTYAHQERAKPGPEKEAGEVDERQPDQTPEQAMADIRAGLLSLAQEQANPDSPQLVERRPWWRRIF